MPSAPSCPPPRHIQHPLKLPPKLTDPNNVGDYDNYTLSTLASARSNPPLGTPPLPPTSLPIATAVTPPSGQPNLAPLTLEDHSVHDVLPAAPATSLPPSSLIEIPLDPSDNDLADTLSSSKQEQTSKSTQKRKCGVKHKDKGKPPVFQLSGLYV